MLPSGARVGHRSLKRYYRQKFAVEDSRDSVVIQKLVSEYASRLCYKCNWFVHVLTISLLDILQLDCPALGLVREHQPRKFAENVTLPADPSCMHGCAKG